MLNLPGACFVSERSQAGRRGSLPLLGSLSLAAGDTRRRQFPRRGR